MASQQLSRSPTATAPSELCAAKTNLRCGEAVAAPVGFSVLIDRRQRGSNRRLFQKVETDFSI